MIRENRLRIAFMGTPDFAVPAFQALLNRQHNIVCAFTQPPKPKGRGKRVSLSPVHELAEGHEIPVHTPISLKKSDEYRYKISTMNLDLIVVAAYGLILPKQVLEAPRFGCLNVHASLLPRWRGASPIQHAILAGDKESGISIMQMDEGLDTGAVVASRSVALGERTTSSVLHDQLAMLGGEMIKDCVQQLSRGKELKAIPQPQEGATYAPMLKKEDGRIDWHKSAFEIDRQIRAFNSWPGVWTEGDFSRFKMLEAFPLEKETDKEPGTLLDRSGAVACGNNTVLKITKLQPPNKKPMDVSSAINGSYLSNDTIFNS